MKILFVCMGNICRSPAGDIVLRQMIDAAKLTAQVSIDSAGTIGIHTGKAPDARMSNTLIKRGYSITGASRKVTEADLEEFDLILAMDHDNFDDLMRLSEKSDHRNKNKIKMFTDYCSEHGNNFVPDPYYGGQDGFDYVADLVEDGCRNLVDKIKINIKNASIT